MRPNTLASAVVLSAVALAAPAGAALSDFRLPEDRPQEQPAPDVQGPVAPDVPASRRAVAPTPSPSASRSAAPVPTGAAAPVVVPSGLAARPSASPAPRAAAPSRATPTPVPTPIAGGTADAAAPPVPGISATPSAPPAVPAATAAPVPEERAEAAGGWSLLAAVPLLLALLALAAWAVRRRTRRPGSPAAVPEIERPRVGTAPAETPAASAQAEPLHVSLEPLRLSLTLMNATLAYRLELANRGAAALTGLVIGADMIAAHASLSREEQLAGPPAGTGTAQRIERLEPGETRVVEGEFRLPFPQIVPIRQGSAALLLPLARFRVEADGARPLVRTFVVGQPGQGSGLQPFRLDQGPRVYPRLAQRAFA